MKDVTLAILAGGEGSRMGRPKGELTIQGKLILDYLLDRFAWDGPTMLVTAPGREHPPGYQRFDLEAVDPEAGLGPLRGVLTALENSTTSRVIVTTVDMPNISIEQLKWLVDHLQESLGLMITRAVNHEMMIEPFPGIFQTHAKTTIAEQLSQYRRSVHGLAELDGFSMVDAPLNWNPNWYTNLNTPEDFHLL